MLRFPSHDLAQDAAPAMPAKGRDVVAPQVHVLRARTIDDAGTTINLVRSRQVVLLRCEDLDARLAQRLVDMVQGAMAAIDGTTRTIGPRLLVAAPCQSPLRQI